MAAPDRARTDVNNQFSLIAVSNADGVSPVSLWADPTTHELITNSSGGGVGDVNLAEVNGITVDVGTGTAGLGTQRVSVSSDSTMIITDINGTITLPTNAAKESGGYLQSISTQLADGSSRVGIVDGGTGTVMSVLNFGTSNAGVVALADENSNTIDSFVVPAVNQSYAAPVQIVNGTGNQITTFPVSNGGTFAVQNTPVAPPSIYSGKTTVTTAGTRVVLASSQAVQSVTIKALSSNTGLIYVGNSSVASSNGYQLSAGDSISMDVANLNTVNIDSAVNGEGVSYIAVG